MNKKGSSVEIGTAFFFEVKDGFYFPPPPVVSAVVVSAGAACSVAVSSVFGSSFFPQLAKIAKLKKRTINKAIKRFI